MASLAGLQYAIELGDPEAIKDAVNTILLLHSMIMSLGGIPLIYYGDELGTLNDDSYQNDPHKAGDSRWVHRPTINWQEAEKRNEPGTVQYQIFTALKRMIAVRKEIEVFADFNNRELIEVNNPYLFVFGRFSLTNPSEKVLVVANFDAKPQHLNLSDIRSWSIHSYSRLVDLYSGSTPDIFKDALVVPGFSFYWLTEM